MDAALAKVKTFWQGAGLTWIDILCVFTWDTFVLKQVEGLKEKQGEVVSKSESAESENYSTVLSELERKIEEFK